MTKSYLRLLAASAVLAAPQMASAALLVGTYGYNGSTPVFETAAPSGVSGSISGPTLDHLTGYDSTDGSYGPAGAGTPAPVVAGSGSFGFGGATTNSIAFTVTNSSTSSYALDSLLFDITRGAPVSTFSVSYSVNGGGSTSLLTNQAISENSPVTPAVDDTSWDQWAVALGFVLSAGDSVTFTFSPSNGGGIDNLGVTTLSPIPETSSVVALGCLLGTGAFFRSRRR